MLGTFLARLERIEAWAQSLQGKGYGASSLTSEVRAAMAFFPQKDAVVFDVGANKGLWTRELLRQAKSRVASVHAFEPSKYNWEEIENIDDARIHLVKAGLSDKKQKSALFYNKPGSGWASLSKRRLDHFNAAMDMEEIVDITTIDDYLADHPQIERVDFAKFDIEGHELSALRGGAQALKNKQIRALAFEFGGTHIDTRIFFQDFWYFFQSYGYELYRIVPWGRPLRIRRYSEHLEVFRPTNYLAVAS